MLAFEIDVHIKSITFLTKHLNVVYMLYFQFIFRLAYDDKSSQDHIGFFGLRKLIGTKQMTEEPQKCHHSVTLFLDKVTDAVFFSPQEIICIRR